MGERLRRGLKLRNKRKIGVGPLKGKNQIERLQLSQTRGRSEGHRKRAGSHRAQRESSGKGRSLTRSYFQAQRQPANRRKCSAGGPGIVPTVREEQLSDPITPEDTQPQRGPPGKNALQGAKRSLQQRLKPHPVGSRVRHQGQPQTGSKGRGGGYVTITWDREEHWRELRTTEDSCP